MSSGSRKKRQSVNQTVGGALLGFEQQVFRHVPPAEELVHHARPDAPIAGADGEVLRLDLPDELAIDDPWAGIEDELADMADPWADYAAEAEIAPGDVGHTGEPAATADDGDAEAGTTAHGRSRRPR